MAMSAEAAAESKSEINITPLVDVVLVLLIIFMVVIPMLQMGYDVNTPPESRDQRRAAADDDQLIVRMDANGADLHQQGAGRPGASSRARLREAIKNRESKIVFFAADGELPYDQVADFMDLCREAGEEPRHRVRRPQDDGRRRDRSRSDAVSSSAPKLWRAWVAEAWLFE